MKLILYAAALLLPYTLIPTKEKLLDLTTTQIEKMGPNSYKIQKFNKKTGIWAVKKIIINMRNHQPNRDYTDDIVAFQAIMKGHN